MISRPGLFIPFVQLTIFIMISRPGLFIPFVQLTIFISDEKCVLNERNKQPGSGYHDENCELNERNKQPGLTLLLASWLSWQDLTKFLLHLGDNGTYGKILKKILLRQYNIPRSYLVTMYKTLRL